jgi:lysophospholipase L1-like esterase
MNFRQTAAIILLTAISASGIIPAENIRTEHNRILVPGGDSTLLNAFFQKLDSIFIFKQGRANILHIGGSHVQAGIFTGRIRRNLDEINSGINPSPGFIFPYSTAKTNNPASYRIISKGRWDSERNVSRNREIQLGISGIAVYTSDPEAEITVSLNTDSCCLLWTLDRLTLAGYAEDGSCDVMPCLKTGYDSYIEPEHDPVAGVYRFQLPSPVDSFTIAFRQTGAENHRFILNGFIPETGSAGTVYHSIGVNGATVRSYLDCELFEKELPLISPDLVIFAIGINDATSKLFSEENFINNYNLLIERIHSVNPGCAFIFITNNDSYLRVSRRKYTVNRRGETVRKAFFKLAVQHSAGVWDLFTIMGGLGSMQLWEKSKLAKHDKVHFTREGYELLGDAFYRAIMEYYLTQVSVR